VECVKDSRRQESEEIIAVGCVNDESRRSHSELSLGSQPRSYAISTRNRGLASNLILKEQGA
jgi:hypothetical protein